MALGMAQSIHELGWSYYAIIYVDDLYGSGYAQDLAFHSALLGLTIATAQKVSLESPASFDQACTSIKDSGARVIVVLVFEQHMELVMSFAEKYGLIGKRGYAWITAEAVSDPENLSANTKDPDHYRDLLQGWISFRGAPLVDTEGFEAWNSAWDALSIGDVSDPALFELNAQSLDQSPICSDLCLYAYDAVFAYVLGWETAYAHTYPECPSGPKVLQEIRKVDFVGASGRVTFDEVGNRGVDGVKVALINWRRALSTGEMVNENLATWTAKGGLAFVPRDEYTPVWPGGDETWKVVNDGHGCVPGQIFEETILDCVSCPPGTLPNNRSACVECEPGFVAPTEGMTRCSIRSSSPTGLRSASTGPSPLTAPPLSAPCSPATSLRPSQGSHVR